MERRNPVFISPGELDAVTASALNVRFAGFLRCLGKSLGVEWEEISTKARDILSLADIEQ